MTTPDTSLPPRLASVALVGRPNVGKSTLFNRLVRRRKAITLDTPGLTRDRNFERADWCGREFMAVDTGGYEPGAEDDLRVAIREQVTIAIEEADVIVFMTDVKQGVTPADHEVVDVLRRTRKPAILAVNKCDNAEEFNMAFSFSELGLDPVHAISALRGHGVGDLLDDVIRLLPKAPYLEDMEDEERDPYIAIVGRQNCGKSTLVNAILGENRMIASPEPGTTRDAIDTPLMRDGKRYWIIDTAGIRRRGRIKAGVEKLSVMRAGISMRRADVAVIMIDAEEGLTEQDAHIAGQAVEAGCGVILAVNKWDLIEKDNSTAGTWAKKLRHELGFLAYAEILFLSALTKQRVHRIFQMVDRILLEHRKKIETAEFNRWLEQALARRPPPTYKGRTVRIKYGTQVGVSPPSFALFVNNPSLVHFSYQRYLINQLRETYGFQGTPVRLFLRAKAENKKARKGSA